MIHELPHVASIVAIGILVVGCITSRRVGLIIGATLGEVRWPERTTVRLSRPCTVAATR